MARAKQLTISAQDRPGTLARIAKVLGDSRVNIMAMNCATFGVQGAIQIIVDDIGKAKEVLDNLRLPYTEEDVLYLELENSPGCLGDLAGKLAAQGINVTTGYGTAIKGSNKASVVLRVSDLEAADRIS
ncbi:MAG: ACT domain-containing protein [Candidatus Acidiferrales bacterium]